MKMGTNFVCPQAAKDDHLLEVGEAFLPRRRHLGLVGLAFVVVCPPATELRLKACKEI